MSEPEPSLTESESQLLALVREGKVDAEVAVRLGLSIAEVKSRTERLIWKMRAKDKAGLRAIEPEQALAVEPKPAKRSTGWRAAPVAALIVLGFAVGVSAGWFGRGGTESLPAAAPTADLVETQAPTVPLPTPTVYATTIAGREMQLLGRPFTGRTSIVPGSVETRETMLVARLAQPSVLRFDEFENDVRLNGGGSNSLALSIQQRDRTILLVLLVEPGARVILGDADSVAFAGSGPGGLTVSMYARAPEGPAFYHLELDVDGRLFISADAVPANALVAFDTGELLGPHTDGGQTLPTGIVAIGDTVQADHWILCGNGTPCTSILRGDFVTRGGTLECDEQSQALTFTTASTTKAILTFRWELPATPLQCREAARAVEAGEALGYGGIHTVSATTLEGTQLSVLITRHGVIYLSRQAPQVGCPCRSGT